MSKIHNFEKYDVIGYKIVSPFHFVALLAYAQRRFPGKTPKILVALSKGPWAEEIVSHESLNIEGFDLDFCNLQDLNSPKSYKVAIFIILKPFFIALSHVLKFQTLDVCSTSIASLKFSCSSVFSLLTMRPIIIDEGLGSYNIERNIRKEIENSKVPTLLKSFIFFLYLFFYESIKIFGGSRQHLFDTSGNRVRIVGDVSQSYQSVFSELYKDQGMSVSADVLFVTQPLTEMGIMSEGAYEGLLRNVEEYAAQKGLSLVVKPHPAECFDKYKKRGMQVIEELGAIEGMIASSSVEVGEVWGFNSTSLITLPALFGLSSKYIVTPDGKLNMSVIYGESKMLFEKYSRPLSL
jgi:hypothetical protein